MSSVTTLSTYVYPGTRAFVEQVANQPISKMPNEVMFKILGYLPGPKDLAVASSVSRKLHELITDEKFQKDYGKTTILEGNSPSSRSSIELFGRESLVKSV